MGLQTAVTASAAATPPARTTSCACTWQTLLTSFSGRVTTTHLFPLTFSFKTLSLEIRREPLSKSSRLWETFQSGGVNERKAPDEGFGIIPIYKLIQASNFDILKKTQGEKNSKLKKKTQGKNSWSRQIFAK